MVTFSSLPVPPSRLSALPPSEVPVTVTREDAGRAARVELSDPAYHRDDPGLVERVATWLLEQLDNLLGRAAGEMPGGYPGLVVLVLVAVVVVVAIRLRVGPLARSGASGPALFAGRPLSADEHRRAADRYAAGGQWALAVRDRLRAIVRDLEERSLLEPRPGRTADEAAMEAGVTLPGCAGDLRAAAQIFDDVWYGDRDAGREMDERLRVVDSQVRATRPTLVPPAVPPIPDAELR